MNKVSLKGISRNWELYVLILPALVYVILFDYIPMYGVQIAFKDFNAVQGIWGSPWVGLQHFERFFQGYYFERLLTGTTLSEYVEETRMNQAKEMLQAKSMSVKEIVERVGYTDQSHFIRKFKKRQGVTPQQYKMLFPNSRE